MVWDRWDYITEMVRYCAVAARLGVVSPPRRGTRGTRPEPARVLGELTLTRVLGNKILALDGGNFRPVTVAEPELWLRWLWRHYQNPYFNATKAVDE